MESFKISTLTEQFPNNLAQGEDGKVILAEDGDTFFLENVFTTEGGDNRAIIAPRLGMIQSLASLTPVFKPGCNALSGEVRLSLEDANNRFPWRFEASEDGNSYTITVREQNIPDGTILPAGGKVFLVWEGTEVKWLWSGGIVPAIPSSAFWVLEKIEKVEPVLEKVKITVFTQTKIAPRSIARGDTGRGVVLTEEGDMWYLRKDPDNPNVKTILAPSLGMLQVLAQLAPIFSDKTDTTAGCHGKGKSSQDTQPQKGELGLSADGTGKPFPWVFDERADGRTTISAPPPPELSFPAGGRVYLVWNLPNEVKWEYSGGVVEDVPSNAMWTVAPFDGSGK